MNWNSFMNIHHFVIAHTRTNHLKKRCLQYSKTKNNFTIPQKSMTRYSLISINQWRRRGRKQSSVIFKCEYFRCFFVYSNIDKNYIARWQISNVVSMKREHQFKCKFHVEIDRWVRRIYSQMTRRNKKKCVTSDGKRNYLWQNENYLCAIQHIRIIERKN